MHSMTAEKPNYNEVKNQYLPQPYANTTELYEDSSSVNGKDFVIGALVGSILGAAAALLLAPKAGKELRHDVSTQANTLKTKSANYSTTVKEKATDLSQKVQEQSAKVVDKAKSLKTQTTPPLDDGTASSEGEEPIEDILNRTVTEVENEEKAFEESVFSAPKEPLPPKG